jgi:hypothetical protein
MHEIIEILGRREVSIDFFEGHWMHTGFMKCFPLTWVWLKVVSFFRVSLRAEEGDFE